MTLLCTSVLALLLLTLSLSESCGNRRLPQGVRDDYELVRILLNNSRDRVATLLRNSSCSKVKYKLLTCTANTTDFLSTLHKLACKMKRLELRHTSKLADEVLRSINCPCERTTNGTTTNSHNSTTAQRWKAMKKKLCKAQAFMAAMTTCYEMLSTQASTRALSAAAS